MKTKSTVAAIGSALAVGAGGGYLGVAVGTPQPASAQPTAAKTQPARGSMMSGGASMMGAEHAGMMRDPAMRRLHQAMVRAHTEMMQDPEMRRLEDQAMRAFPAMARMMREHMGS